MNSGTSPANKSVASPLTMVILIDIDIDSVVLLCHVLVHSISRRNLILSLILVNVVYLRDMFILY